MILLISFATVGLVHHFAGLSYLQALPESELTAQRAAGFLS
jgi:hypothetical protein